MLQPCVRHFSPVKIVIFSKVYKKGLNYKLRGIKKILTFSVAKTWLAGCAVTVCMALAASGFAGCGNTAQSDSTTLKLSTWGSAEELTLLRKLVDAFEQRHPKVRVEIVHIPENYFQKLHILLAGGLAPDVIFVNSLSYPVYADSDIFLPLDQLLDEPVDALGRETFFETSLKALTWEKKLYAIPRDVSNLVVYYNADLFRQAGVQPPGADWTMADLVRLGKKLTRDVDHDGKRDQWGVSFYPKPPLFWLPFVWSEGGDIFDKTLAEFELDSADAAQALQFYADLRHRYHVAPTREEAGSANASQLFLQNKLAMMVSGRWTVPVLRTQAKFNWDVAPFPRGKAGSVVGVDASGYAIAKSTKHPRESWELIAFLSSPEAQDAFSESGLIVPARKDVAQSEAFLAAPPAHGRYFVESIETGYPSHTPVRWNEIAEELNLALEPVWEGREKAGVAMRRVAPRIEKLLQ